jgi:hypothetical protein
MNLLMNQYVTRVCFEIDSGRVVKIRHSYLTSAAHRSNAIKQTAKQINQICQNLISNQINPKP